MSEHDKNWEASLQKRILALEAEAAEHLRVRNLFGNALNRIGVDHVAEDGKLRFVFCKVCKHSKSTHAADGTCPSFKHTKTKYKQ
jgi:rubrerythrin